MLHQIKTNSKSLNIHNRDSEYAFIILLLSGLSLDWKIENADRNDNGAGSESHENIDHARTHKFKNTPIKFDGFHISNYNSANYIILTLQVYASIGQLG